MGSLYDQAKKDIETITSDLTGWARLIRFEAPTSEIAQIRGIHDKHHLGVHPENGGLINSKTAHISVSEKFLTDLSYPIRNTSGEVELKNHKIDVQDSTGEIKFYVIREAFANETLGLITCLLEDRENG